MNFKGTDIKVTVGKTITTIYNAGNLIDGNEAEVKELKSFDGITDKELMLNILKHTNFSFFGDFGLITNKLTGGFLKVNEITSPFNNYLSKDYFADIDKNDMYDEQYSKQLDYDSFTIFAIIKNDEAVGLIILGGETDDEEEFYGIPDFKLIIVPSKMLSDTNDSTLIQLLDLIRD